MKQVVIIFISLFVSLQAFALSIEDVAKVQSPDRLPWWTIVANPAIQMQQQDVTLSQFYGGYDYKNEDSPFVQQLGKGLESWKLEANSFVVLSPQHSAWGFASYTNGKRKAVNWNSTSDYELLYPYIMADSIGGDLSFEEYRFGGGYGMSLTNKLRLGGKMDFRAMQEYRGIDPRPRNLITDLGFNVGVAYDISSAYFIGLDATLRKYKQNNSVTFLNELGKVNEFQMLGFGYDYQRFSGRETSLYHKGTTYGAEITLFPNRNGLFVNLSTQASSYTRTATSLNAFPITTLYKYNNIVDVGHNWNINRIKLWINGSAYLETKKGKENIAGDANSSIYPIIGELEMFKSHDFRTNIYLKMEWKRDSYNLFWVKPTFGYIDYGSKYQYPANNLDISKARAGIRIGAYNKISSHLSLNWNLGVEYSKNIELKYNIGNSASRGIIQNNIQQASADLMSYDFHIRADYIPQKWQVGLFVELNGALQTNSEKNKRTELIINTGITF